MWPLNPRAHERLIHSGLLGFDFAFVVAAFCAAAAVGLFRGKLWGQRIAVLVADMANVVSGTEPIAIVGVPIASVFLIYPLHRKMPLFFAEK